MSERACGICGTPAPPPFRAPQPEIAPDLDMRPGEPVRSMLPDWIQTCRRCGAAAPDLATLPAEARAVVESDSYRSLSVAFLSETVPFRRWAMICERLGDQGERAEALLQAAWAADDAAAMSEAAALRTEVASLWDDSSIDMERGVRRLDVLRRAGLFEQAETWAEHLAELQPDELAGRIISFQKSRIAIRDIGRHLISAALPPPSHTPHVAHTKRNTTGFWSRLLRS